MENMDRLVNEEDIKKLEEEKKKQIEEKEENNEEVMTTEVYVVRTTSNREEQAMEYIERNVLRKKLEVYSLMHPHGMRGYLFIEAKDYPTAQEAIAGVPYVKGLLSKKLEYKEIEPHIELGKREIDIRKNDIAEIISGPFKKDQCKIIRVDKAKGEVVVQLLDAAVQMPITVSIDSIKVIRREKEE